MIEMKFAMMNERVWGKIKRAVNIKMKRWT